MIEPIDNFAMRASTRSVSETLMESYFAPLWQGDRIGTYALALLLIAGWWLGSRLLRTFREAGRAGRLERDEAAPQPRRRLPLK